MLPHYLVKRKMQIVKNYERKMLPNFDKNYVNYSVKRKMTNFIVFSSQFATSLHLSSPIGPTPLILTDNQYVSTLPHIMNITWTYVYYNEILIIFFRFDFRTNQTKTSGTNTNQSRNLPGSLDNYFMGFHYTETINYFRKVYIFVEEIRLLFSANPNHSFFSLSLWIAEMT